MKMIGADRDAEVADSGVEQIMEQNCQWPFIGIPSNPLHWDDHDTNIIMIQKVVRKEN